MADRRRKWDRVAERHSRAVEKFVASAGSFDDAQWLSPLGEGKWSPEQVTQHLIQTYHTLDRQVQTGEGLKVRTGWLLRRVLRVVVLRPIMWTRRLPPGAKAPKPLLPGAAPISKDDAIDRLRSAVGAFERALAERRTHGDLQLTHHIFGSVDALRGLDFVAVHTEHHERQLSAAIERLRG